MSLAFGVARCRETAFCGMSRSGRRWYLRPPHVHRPHVHQPRHRAACRHSFLSSAVTAGLGAQGDAKTQPRSGQPPITSCRNRTRSDLHRTAPSEPATRSVRLCHSLRHSASGSCSRTAGTGSSTRTTDRIGVPVRVNVSVQGWGSRVCYRSKQRWRRAGGRMRAFDQRRNFGIATASANAVKSELPRCSG